MQKGLLPPWEWLPGSLQRPVRLHLWRGVPDSLEGATMANLTRSRISCHQRWPITAKPLSRGGVQRGRRATPAFDDAWGGRLFREHAETQKIDFQASPGDPLRRHFGHPAAFDDACLDASPRASPADPLFSRNASARLQKCPQDHTMSHFGPPDSIRRRGGGGAWPRFSEPAQTGRKAIYQAVWPLPQRQGGEGRFCTKCVC